ncbi:hypothetical protein O181_002995 [Austropuccinia psidii MF-1]|uniref:Uncharacterized protein n=1 Tax=Austropuccinia psidii MF-1 TaxID=1389203 RepID=A0A9Q3BDJ0_9BASI|nr:hypothetical protein [Austropuccinia psidii MF-1]
MTWFVKQKDRLTFLHPDMSGTMVHKRILRKLGCDLVHSIRSRGINPYLEKIVSIPWRTSLPEQTLVEISINHNGKQTNDKPTSRPNKAHDRAPLKVNLIRLILFQRKQELTRYKLK